MTNNDFSALSTGYILKFVIEDLIAVIILNKYIFNFAVYPMLKLFNMILGADNIREFTRGGGLKIGPLILLKGLFGGGGALPEPFGQCGVDPTEGELECFSFPPCLEP